MSDNKKELIKKLKVLAEKGEGGEKDKAEILLKKLMDKYGVSEGDIAADIKEYYEFEVCEWTQQLVVQVASTVIGSDFEIYRQKEKEESTIALLLSTTEYLEIQAKYEFYLKAFREEFQIFRRAFITSNTLYHASCLQSNDNEYTSEDLKVLKIALSIEKRFFNKQLN
jgi:hypothetical protein